jgi:hypothetical protein
MIIVGIVVGGIIVYVAKDTIASINTVVGIIPIQNQSFVRPLTPFFPVSSAVAIIPRRGGGSVG